MVTTFLTGGGGVGGAGLMTVATTGSGVFWARWRAPEPDDS